MAHGLTKGDHNFYLIEVFGNVSNPDLTTAFKLTVSVDQNGDFTNVKAEMLDLTTPANEDVLATANYNPQPGQLVWTADAKAQTMMGNHLTVLAETIDKIQQASIMIDDRHPTFQHMVTDRQNNLSLFQNAMMHNQKFHFLYKPKGP